MGQLMTLLLLFVLRQGLAVQTRLTSNLLVAYASLEFVILQASWVLDYRPA